MFCSNVSGVMRDKDPSTRIASLIPEEVRALVSEGVIQGGMIPKVRVACCVGTWRRKNSYRRCSNASCDVA